MGAKKGAITKLRENDMTRPLSSCEARLIGAGVFKNGYQQGRGGSRGKQTRGSPLKRSVWHPQPQAPGGSRLEPEKEGQTERIGS